MRLAETILSFGLNLVIERIGVNSRWVWALIALNEIRGAVVAWEVGKGFF